MKEKLGKKIKNVNKFKFLNLFEEKIVIFDKLASV